MDLIRFFKVSLIISVPVTIVGALFKLMHWPGASILLQIGLLCILVYTAIALYLIFRSRKPIIEKFLWLIGIVCFGLIAGIIFYFIEIPKHSKKKASGDKPVMP